MQNLHVFFLSVKKCYQSHLEFFYFYFYFLSVVYSYEFKTISYQLKGAKTEAEVRIHKFSIFDFIFFMTRVYPRGIFPQPDWVIEQK